MNTHPNEDTLYDNVNNVKNPNEETMIDNNVVSNNVNNNGPKTKSRFGRVASGLGMGILLGGTSSFVTAKTIHAAEKDDINEEEENNNGEEINNETDNNNETNNGTDVIDTPNNEGTDEWSDGALPVAESVNDSMSFSEAFSTARAEVGPGGVFEWRGNVYNTYYAEEWNNMSEEDKSEFVNHLSLTEIEDEPETSDDVVEIVVVDEVNANETIEVTAVNEVNQEPEVQVYGVYHDEEYDMNVGVATIDEQEVLFIDADDDGENFEYMACDFDEDGQIDENEIVDISEYEMPVDSLMIDNSQMAYDDTLDYTSDADVYDMM